MWFVIYHFYGDAWVLEKLCRSLDEAEDEVKRVMRAIMEIDAGWEEEELRKNFTIKVVSELPVPVSLQDI